MSSERRLAAIPMQRYRPSAPPRTCDQCGHAPCQTWTLCRRFRDVEREIKRRREREWRWLSYQPTERPEPAAATIEAYEYLRRLGDRERLQRFLDAHPELGE